MSSLLEEAIVDATALKEAALKNAEHAVLEKYSGEVKDALKTLLEQDEGLTTEDDSADMSFAFSIDCAELATDIVPAAEPLRLGCIRVQAMESLTRSAQRGSQWLDWSSGCGSRGAL